MKRPTQLVTIRMPCDLVQRLDELAQKSITTRSAWVVRTLERESKPKKSKEVAE